MEKGQLIETTIEDMSNEGQGIGKVDGMAVFINCAVPGDKVKAQLTKVKKNYAFGRMVEITEPSQHRVEPSCSYSGSCGGCMLGGLDYMGQLGLKEKQVRDKLVRLAGIENPRILPILGMENPYNYRNKAQMQISCGGMITRKGGVIENAGPCAIGFYKVKTHDVVNCNSCMLQAPTAAAIAEAVRHFVKTDNIIAYDPKWEKGLLRGLVVKTAFNTGEVMVILIVNGKGIPNGEKLIAMMDEAINALPEREDGSFYSLESVILNVNKKKDAVMGEECITLAGKDVISEVVNGYGYDDESRFIEGSYDPLMSDAEMLSFCDEQELGRADAEADECSKLHFEISPLSFYQVNPVQMEALYAKAIEYMDLKGHETVLDLYCGVGTIGIFCANEMRRLCKERYGAVDYSKMGRVIGIESVKGAVQDANRNATINGLANAYFICGRAEVEVAKLVGAFGLGVAEAGLDGMKARLEAESDVDDLWDDVENAGLGGVAGGVDYHRNDTEATGLKGAVDADDLGDGVENDRLGDVAGGVVELGMAEAGGVEPGDGAENVGLGGVAGGVDYHRSDAEATGLKGAVDAGMPKKAPLAPKYDICQNGPIKPDVVILDPPRNGCAPELLDAVAVAAPSRIVYVSCDPATLARDIKILGEKGYSFVEATPIDMFPHTGHVECVVLMSRVQK